MTVPEAAREPLRAAPVAPVWERLGDRIELAVEVAAILLLLATAFVALLQVFCRYVLGDALAWPEEAAKYLFVWFVFLGAAMVTRRGQHITIDLLRRSLPPALLRWHAAFTRGVSAAASAFLLVFGWQLTVRATFVSPALEWPHTYLYLAVPVGAAIALLLKLLTPIEGWRGLASTVVAVACGVALALLLAWLGERGVFGFPQSVVWPLVLLVIGLMMIGVPLVDALVFGTCAAFLPRGAMILTAVPQGMVNGLDYLLVAIPFFILAAGLMNVGGITHRLVALATTLVGHFRGGLGYVNVLTNTLMSGVSGSSTADAAAIAKTLVTPMADKGYPKPFSVALTSSASILANLIPPSLGLIIYASLASVSVGALFVGTIVPGLLMAATLAIVVYLTCRIRGFGWAEPKATWAQRGAAARLALPALALPLLIIGGIRYGAFSATEAGAVAALYALACGTLIYRSANRADPRGAGRARGDRDRDGGDRGVGAVRLCAGHRAGASADRRVARHDGGQLDHAAAGHQRDPAVRRSGDGDDRLDGHPGAAARAHPEGGPHRPRALRHRDGRQPVHRRADAAAGRAGVHRRAGHQHAGARHLSRLPALHGGAAGVAGADHLRARAHAGPGALLRLNPEHSSCRTS
jgi:TRAP-type C4-dicarboxylate transport system permease small subunit